MEELKKCLKDMTVFARLEGPELKLICERSYERIYKQGEIIFFENDSHGAGANPRH